MADRLQSPSKVSASFSEDVEKTLNPESYAIFLSVLKTEGRTDSLDREEKQKIIEDLFGNRDDLIQKWMELQGDSPSSDPPVDAAEGCCRRNPSDAAEKQKKESEPDVKKEGLVKNKSLDAAEEQKRKTEPDVKKEGLVKNKSLDAAEEQKRKTEPDVKKEGLVKKKSLDAAEEHKMKAESDVKKEGLVKKKSPGAAQKQKRKTESDVKKEGLVKNKSPDDEKENLGEDKPPFKSSLRSAKGAKFDEEFSKAIEFIKDVKRELFFTNPDAFQQFLDIFEQSKRHIEDLVDRLRVVAKARVVIGHREDLMKRLVEFAMGGDLPVDKPLGPLQPLGTADGRGVKRSSIGALK